MITLTTEGDRGGESSSVPAGNSVAQFGRFSGEIHILPPFLVAFADVWWYLITFDNRQYPWGAAGQSDVSLVNIMQSIFFIDTICPSFD